jgi:putative ABC transport system permease protein
MPFHDLRYGLRLMARRPGFALVAVTTLALAIGANTAIFSLVDRVLLRAVPFPSPDRLAVVWETNPELPVPVMVVSPPTLADWMTRNRSFSDIGAFRWRNVTLGGTDPERVVGASVNASLLRALGVQPGLGRLFRDEEDRANAAAVVLLSDGLWRRRFNADPSILGRTIVADGVPHEVVGVMPPGYLAPPPVAFRGRPPSDRAELWVPLAIDLAGGQRGAHYLTVIGRLKPGVSVDAADADMARVAREIGVEHPDYRQWSTRVVPLDTWVTASSRRSMTLLTAAVGFVLLLASANVANLLLARSVGRRREFAVRTALGAGRVRLGMQMLGESMALAAVGGAIGMALALLLIRVIATYGPASIPGLRDARFDLRAALFAVVASMMAAVLASVAPAISIVRAELKSWLTSRSGSSGAGGSRTQKALVVGQVGMAVVLLVTAAFLVQSFRQLRALDPGFRPESVVTGRVSLPAAGYADGPSRARFVAALLARVRAIPGVAAAGVTDAVPLADNRQGTDFRPIDAPPADPSKSPTVNVAYVTDGFFEALGMRQTRGRVFSDRDTADAPRVVVINDSLARQMYADRDPVGRLASLGIARGGPFEIIGVVADDRHFGMETSPTPSFFVSYGQFPSMRDIGILVRGAAGTTGLSSSIRAAIRELDAELPFFQVRLMEDVVSTSMATPRSLAWLLSGFAIVGLMLAAIGVFGVLSHAVSQRTQEIGVRMAVGASPAGVLAMIVRDALTQVGLGLVLGLGLTWMTSQLLSGLLFGVSTTSPMPYLIVAAVLVGAALIAALAPARRAMRIDPAIALRAET